MHSTLDSYRNGNMAFSFHCYVILLFHQAKFYQTIAQFLNLFMLAIWTSLHDPILMSLYHQNPIKNIGAIATLQYNYVLQGAPDTSRSFFSVTHERHSQLFRSLTSDQSSTFEVSVLCGIVLNCIAVYRGSIVPTIMWMINLKVHFDLCHDYVHVLMLMLG